MIFRVSNYFNSWVLSKGRSFANQSLPWCIAMYKPYRVCVGHQSGQLTSLFLYRELMMSFIIRLTSAWKTCFSDFSRISLICAAFKPSNWMASSSLWDSSEKKIINDGITFTTTLHCQQAVQHLPLSLSRRCLKQANITQTTPSTQTLQAHPARLKGRV